jgi:hypothetical protein
MYISGIPVGDLLGFDGSPVDSRAATGDIIADTDGIYDIGSAGSKWGSGYFVLSSGVTVSGVDVGAGTQIYISGINVGDFLSPHTVDTSGIGAAIVGADKLTPSDLTFASAGSVSITSNTTDTITISGVPGGGSAGVNSINGISGALTLAGASGVQIQTAGSTLTVDGQNFMLTDGSRAFTATASGEDDFGVATQLWISGIAVGNNLLSDHEQLAGLGDDDHTQYLLMDGDRSTSTGTTSMSGIFQAVSGIFDDSVTISGIEIGDFLSSHTIDTSGIGAVIASGTTVYPSELTVDGAGTVVTSVAGSTLTISGIAAAVSAGVDSVNTLTGAVGVVGASGVQIDASGNNIVVDGKEFILQDGSRAFTGTASGETDLGAATQLWISGVPVGDRLYTESEIETQIDGRITGGTLATSGTTVGAATQVYVSGVSIGDFLSPHANDTAIDNRAATGDILMSADVQNTFGTAASRVGSGLFLRVSGVDVDALTQMSISGIDVGDRLQTEADITALAEAFLEGGTADPASGVNVGAATQVYVSGIAMGDFLSPHTTDTALDNRAATGNVTADTDGAYDVGSAATRFGSGHFVLASGTIVSGIDVGASDQLWVSGVPIGDFLSAHPAAITSINGENGPEITLVGGSGVFLTVGGDQIVIDVNASGGGASAGVTSVNGLSGILTFTGQSGVRVFASGSSDVHFDGQDLILVDGTRAFTGTASGEVGLGVDTQLWISGIPVGDNLLSDHGQLAGLNDDDHEQYFLGDASRAISGNLIPDADNTHSIGTFQGQTFASGVFQRVYIGSGYVFDFPSTSELVFRRADEGGAYNIRAATVSGSNVVGANTQVYISGTAVGNYLSSHTENTSGVGRITDDFGSEITPTNLSIIGSGGIETVVSGASAIAVAIPNNTFLPFASGAEVRQDHGTLDGLTDDDHTQYLLRSDFASSGAAEKPVTSGTTLGAGTTIYLSGISIGDRIRTEAAITALAEEFVEGGTADPASGVNVGASTQMYISGIAIGDLLEKGTGNPVDGRAATGDISPDTDVAYDLGTATLKWGSGYFQMASGVITSGVDIGAGTQAWVSGIPVGDRLYTESDIDTQIQALVEGGTLDPVSGVNVGASTQIYISGISIGDNLVNNHGQLAGLSNDDHPQYLPVNGDRGMEGFLTCSGGFTSLDNESGSIIIGSGVTANADAIAIGLNGDASGIESIAIGDTVSVSGTSAVGVGPHIESMGANSVAVGRQANTDISANGGIAIGFGANVIDTNTVAIGTSTNANGTSAIAIGNVAQATNNDSVSIGGVATTTADNQIRLGSNHYVSIPSGVSGVGLEVQATISGISDIGAATQIWISGIPVGDNLGGGSADGSGIGAVIASGSTIYPSELTVNGEGTVVTSVAGSTLTISGIALPAGSPVDSRAATGDIAVDVDVQYKLGEAALAWGSGFFQLASGVDLSGSTSVGAGSQIYISGIDVGNRLYTEAEINTQIETLVEGGTLDPVSGVNAGAATQIYISGISLGDNLLSDHGQLAGLGDDDHAIYSLVDGTRAFTGAVSGEAGLGIDGILYVSGVPISTYARTEAQITSLAETFIEGGTADPASGVNIGAATQIYVSGVSVGDFLSTAAPGSPVDSRAATGDISPDTDVAYDLGSESSRWGSGHFLLASGVTVSGTDMGASSQVWISGIPVGDNLGQGGGSPVDARAATGDILPDTSGAYQVGATGTPFGSGAFDALVLNDTNGVSWRITVGTNGKLTTTSLN